MEYVHVALNADGQRLEVQAPPVLANGAIDRLLFDVSTSEHWEGLEIYVVLRGSGGSSACKVEHGSAVADAATVSAAGFLEVALAGYAPGRRLTTQRVTMRLANSGL